MPTTVGQPSTYHKKFKFVVEIDGVASAAFQKCSEISVEMAVVATRQGGALIPTKEPGLATVAPITLERGATDSLDLWNWFKEVADLAANSGITDGKYKRNLDIVQQDRDGTEKRRWKIANAWPSKFVAGGWDNDANENTMEQVILEYDYPNV